MAIVLPMKISDLISSMRDTLQDLQKNRWTDIEIYKYIDQAIRDIAVRTKYNRIVQEISVVDGTDTYTLDFQLLAFYGTSSVQAIDFPNNATVKFPEMKEETVLLEYYALPDRIIYGVVSELSLDEDIYDMIRLFCLAKCYMKEDTAEWVQKASAFKSEYNELVELNMTRWQGSLDVPIAKNDYYI